MRELGKHIISNSEYHSDKDYLSSSVVKIALNGAQAFRHYMDNPKANKSSPAMDFGTLVHTMVLEGHNFENEYHVHEGETTDTGLIPAKVRREYEAMVPNKTVITRASYELAQKILANCKADPKVYDLLFKDADGENEVSYFTICPTTQLAVKVRLDRGIINRAIIVDLKTAMDVSHHGFQKEVRWNRHYDLSAYMYVLQVQEATGVLCDFYWVVAGKDEVCPIAVYKASTKTLLDGKDKYERAMANIKRAMDTAKGEALFYQDEIELM